METIEFDPSQYIILVVEDNATNMRLLIELLLDDGYQVEAAVNGLEALEMAEAILPDLVLLDVMMPGLNGYEVCAKLQENPQTQEIPIIFITAIAQVADKIKAFELGAVDYITKPFNTREVMIRLKRHLIRRSQYQYLEQKITTLQQSLFACCSHQEESSSIPQNQNLDQLVHEYHELKDIEKSLRESEERWHLAFLGNNDGIWDWNIAQNQVFYSPTWKSMLGYTEPEISNHPDEWKNRIHPDDINRVMTALREHLDQKSPGYVEEHRLRCKDGSYKWVLGRGKALWDDQGRLVRMVGSNTDISDLKQTQKLLKEAKDLAEKASQEKTSFLDRISHESLTPLNAIIGLSELVIKELRMQNQWLPKHLDCLQLIHRSGKDVLKMINDILDFSHLRNQEIGLSNRCIDLDEFLYCIEQRYRTLSKKLNLTFTLHKSSYLPQFIKIDDRKLCQVLGHLLGNSFKFTESGEVSLTVEIVDYPPSPPLVRFRVADTGPGIAAEEIGNIFIPFAQIETGNNSQSGTGLGVCISEQLVQLMGGSIRVCSEVGSGTQVQVDLPLTLPAPDEEPAPCISQPIMGLAYFQRNYRILIADRQLERRSLIGEILGEVGFRIQVAVNGEETIELWKTWHPDLILISLHLPGMKSYTPIERIRQSIKGQDCVIIALADLEGQGDRQELLAAGYNDSLNWPVLPEQLLEKIGQSLGINYIYGQSLDPSAPETN